MERFDWKAQVVRRKKSPKSWDAVRQLTRYGEVVGIDEPILVQAVEGDDLFRDGLRPQKSSGSD
jgi:hypothetical protein